MAATAGLPLSLDYGEDRNVLLLSDSEGEDLTPPVRNARRIAADPQDAIRRKTEAAAANVPLHPIPAMQAAFSESLIEATNQAGAGKPKFKNGDAKERRSALLEGAKSAKLDNDLWRYRPGQEHHELWKLLAQISFGVYLLLGGIANSNEQVVTILQGHIDEVDEFLETTMEDVHLAIKDVKERIDFLKLPMANMATFEKMLEDRNFRLQIVNGNEKIEHIVARTTKALDGTLDDVEEGLKAVKEFAIYLGNEESSPWRQERPAIAEIYDAMTGNAEGWWKALTELQDSTTVLDGLLAGLGRMVAEMDQRAGEVSRRTRFSVAPYSEPTESIPSKHSSVRSHQASTRRASDVPSGRAPSDVASNRSSALHSRTDSQKRMTRTSTQGSHRSSHSSGSSAGGILLQPVVFQGSTAELERETMGPRDDQRLREPLAIVNEDICLEIGIEEDEDDESGPEEQGLFILQPRTYTPQPPAPLPSPMIQKPVTPKSEDFAVKRTSLRQRVSLKGGNVPNKLQVAMGPRHAVSVEVLRTERSSEIRTSQIRTADFRNPDPRMSDAPQNAIYLSPTVYRPDSQHRPDSAQTANSEHRPRNNSASTAGTDAYRHSGVEAMPSPHSERQFYRPVQASPHSPLQQRPWTSTGPSAPNHQHALSGSSTSSHHRPQHSRNQPSRMGMSMLSNVTTHTQQAEKTVKKKRSAFGWFKKAFALDESERAEFEARKNQQFDNSQYQQEQHGRKFLDGKRLPEHQRYQNY
ncbi:hypothetical protein Micbo1qcDRAFT_66230 [Microdochium bolleyi]|uniref:Uncharacterized protein n=1 Tax=Microdochium bolleyi TaxID=196109 RepID=A0A136J2T9_9PEZI|nr:hypothetical protein Micbo1qcDRAFT_66230 [Microdochium bolleyi]